ncbi:MAG: peptidase T [Desulfobacterales bacterium]|nr:peptidase T [Desulfobacterales bacterium]
MNHDPLAEFLRNDAIARFLRYVQVDTRSDDASEACPSTPGQRDLGRLLAGELVEMGLDPVELDADGYVYVTVPASAGAVGPAITFCAHMDTSPSESGAGVRPVLHENYPGGPIRFVDNPDLVLTPEMSPELLRFLGDTIITASGETLLGADDKAGLAAIMTALAALCRFADLPRPELRVVFTPDEEIGRGADHIDIKRLGTYGYTVDGGVIGELEAECFDAHKVVLNFIGRNIHPGTAKGKMINAAAIAARFVADLPERETPEQTEGREGFWHLTELDGNEGRARAVMILRDFDAAKNVVRIEALRRQVRDFQNSYPGLRIDMTATDQYRNMAEVLDRHPKVTAMAEKAMIAAGIDVIRKPIRGGTDGARLSFMGMPCPNLFAGGLMFHSKTEWIPATALEKSAETILHLCRLWAES